MDDDIARLLREVARRSQTEKPAEWIDFLKGAFPEQIAFLKDPAPFKAAHCARGAAKSYTAGLGIYGFMQKYPGCNCFYVTKTRDQARNIMWKDVMKRIDSDFQVGIEFNETLLEGRHPNGSTFRLTGIDGDRKQQDKLLGGKYKLVVLDEVAFFDTSLDEIIGKLSPATGRIGGSIWMMSTSSDLTRGLFYEVTRKEHHLRTKGWSVHEWSWINNPYVRDHLQKMHDQIVEDNPLIVETNLFKQHWYNEWTIDDNMMVYKFSPSRNLIAKLPDLHKNGWSYVLGIDTGWEDDNAFVLTAYHQNDPHLYVLRIHKEPKMTFDQVILKTNQFLRDPFTHEHLPCRVIIDGSAKQGVESMRQRSSIPFEPSDKQDKVTFIELMNADLVQGKIKILDTPDNKPLCDEMSKLLWVKEGDRIKFPKKEHPMLPNHLCFVAGTLIRTPEGEVPIETLKIGDLVETRKGPRRINYCINRNSQVVMLSLSNNTQIMCTPDHPFWSAGKWIAAKDLKSSDLLLSWSQHLKERNEFIGMVTPTDDTKVNISPIKTNSKPLSHNYFIEIFGNFFMGRFQKIITFITRTKTQVTTVLTTWNAYLPLIIEPYIHSMDVQKSWINTGIVRLNGMAPKQVLSGIGSMAERQSHLLMQNVPGVRKNILNLTCRRIKKDAAPLNVLLRNVVHLVLTMKNAFARSVQKLISKTNMLGREPVPLNVLNTTAIGINKVYNITVEDQHEYFANEILVSNCDAFLYSWRMGYHYHSAPAESRVPIGSRGWYERTTDEQNIWEQERDRMVNNDWSEEPGFSDEFKW